MTHWAQLLHFYQPPTQVHSIIRKVADESYRPLLRVLHEHPNARVAVNMQGILTELLLEHGLADIVDSLRELAEKGQVEFVGSGKYHPILPLIPAGERARAIEENDEMNGRAFGDAWKPRGFFPPEMCFSEDITPAIHAAGHHWLIISGVACPVAWPIDVVHRVEAGAGSLAVLFRDDVRSNRISFRQTDPARFLEDLSRVGGASEAYVVTAMDAETFGHHITAWEREFLAETFNCLASQKGRGGSRVKMVLPSELVALYPAGETVRPHASSWSTSNDDIAAHDPFPLWKSPGNPLHAMQWEYVEHCAYLLTVARRYATTEEAREFADIAGDQFQPGLHSCQFWWASRRPMWSVTMIHRGFLLLNEVAFNAARAIAFGTAPDEVKREARWRLAAADRLRLEIERELATRPAP